MDYKTFGKLEDNEIIYINKISKENKEDIKKIYRIKTNGKYRNIIEEKNTIYEVDYECVNHYTK